MKGKKHTADPDLSRIGPHSDIYILGATLFEVLAGFPPHPLRRPDGTQLSLQEMIDNGRENVIVDTTAKGELFDIAMKAMRTDPRDRYQSVDEFMSAVESAQ